LNHARAQRRPRSTVGTDTDTAIAIAIAIATAISSRRIPAKRCLSITRAAQPRQCFVQAPGRIERAVVFHVDATGGAPAQRRMQPRHRRIESATVTAPPGMQPPAEVVGQIGHAH
jgi:hypothetical protein